MRLSPRLSPRVALPVIAAMMLLVPAAVSGAVAGPLTVDASVTTHQASAAHTITSGALTTSNANDLLVAFIASDGPNAAGGQSIASVTGGGLTWKLAQRTNSQPGTAEVWEAVAASPQTNLTVTATRSAGSYVGSITVVAFAGADTQTLGATGTGNGATGAPSASLTTTTSGSWVWGIGNDWDAATSRTLGAGQTMFDQYLASVGDTYWVQSQTAPGSTSGSTVTLNDTAPTTDHWDLSTVEIRPAAPDTVAPSVPQNLTATSTTSNQVSLSWTASTDNVGVSGYDILRNGSQIATSTTNSFVDNSVAPATNYSYTVQAYDAAGNVSGPSPAASVTTPAASTAAPVISGVTTSALSTTSATINWTTDIPSSSQILYGSTAQYGQSTTADATQVTTHSQTLTGLTPGTTYHYSVVSTGSASNTASSPDATFTTLASTVTLPDMQMKVPTADISIGTNATNGHRQLQFTHITWDAGPGPFEIDPKYNSATGTATFTQKIYQSSSPGVWTPDYSVSVPAVGVFDKPSDYQFPLTRFTLNNVNADGSIGSVVTTSPKTDYCITGDTYVGGVPNTPNASSPNPTNCTNPALPLGFSVGWGDQYDQTDNGQPIDLSNVPDGTYILRGTVDPDHVLTETNTANNVTDTELQISGGTVTILNQTSPTVTPPTVAMASPADGSSVSGTVTLTASPAAGPGTSVASVQFLLDGQPLGAPVTSAPWSYAWTVGSTSLGAHTLSVRATDSAGNVSTAASVSVNVVSGTGGGGTDTVPPTVAITNPTSGETVSGTSPLAANATDDTSVSSVQFYVDGQAVGAAVTTSPYAINWDTTKLSNGSHSVTAVATDSAGLTTTSAAIPVTVSNPAPPMTCFVMDVKTSAHGSGTVTTPAFHTAMAGEKLYAFVSSDGPNAAGAQSATVSGAGLTWTLVKRANAQPGDAEVWQASASTILSNVTVTSTLLRGGYAQDLTVIAMEDVSGVGASVAGSASTGAPSLTLTTTGATSLVFAVGDDWDNAIARTLPSGWALLDQWTNASSGDDYWSQYTNTPTGAAGQTVTIGDTAPTTDRWNMVGVELRNAGS